MLPPKHAIDFSKEFVRHLEKSIVFFERFEDLERVVSKLEEKVSEIQSVHNQTLRLINEISLKLEGNSQEVRPERLQEIVKLSFEKSSLKQELLSIKRMFDKQQTKSLNAHMTEVDLKIEQLLSKSNFDVHMTEVDLKIEQLNSKLDALTVDFDRQTEQKVAKIGIKMSTIHTVCLTADFQVHRETQCVGSHFNEPISVCRKVYFEKRRFVESRKNGFK